MTRFVILIMLVGVILAGCDVGNQGGVYVTQTPLPYQVEFLNPNPELVNGKCPTVSFYDEIFGQVVYKQCRPEHYQLYELRQKITGYSDLFADRPTTLPIRISYSETETGHRYTIHPGGRAGRIGWISPLIEFEPGCKRFDLIGVLSLEGTPEEYGAGVMVGADVLWQSQLPTNGDFMMSWYWLVETPTIKTVTVFLNFHYGSATASSYVNIHRFEITETELDLCP